MKFFCSIPKAISELKKGHMLIVVDSPKRENQGDLIFPAETVTKQKVNFALSTCRGLVCVAITRAKAAQLDLPLMVDPIHNREKTRVNFTISVDAKDVSSFGISVADRAKTIKILAYPGTKPGDLVRPGHVFPLVSADGGVTERAGHTEAAVELARLAGYTPCGVLSEVLRYDGEVARLSDLVYFSKKFNIKIVSMTDLINYLKDHPKTYQNEAATVVREASSSLPTLYGTFHLFTYRSIIDNREHIALLMGRGKKGPILARIHSQCLTGDTLLSLKCDCRQQLRKSMEMISKRGQGIIIYLAQEGRGIGLTNKIKAYALQEKGLDTVEANCELGFPPDARDYKVAAEIFHDLGILKVILLTNNLQKVRQLSNLDINVVKRLPLEVTPTHANNGYLLTKKYKLGHQLSVV